MNQSRIIGDEVNSMTPEQLNVYVQVPVNLSGTSPNHGGGMGPCEHYAKKMMVWLSKNAGKKGWTDLKATTILYLAQGIPGVSGHIIVKVTYTESDGNSFTLLLDAGELAKKAGNIGDRNGVIDPGDLDKLTKKGAFPRLIEQTPVDPRKRNAQ